MDQFDQWRAFLVDDSAAVDDVTMPLIDLTSDESTDLNVTSPNVSNPVTSLLADNSQEEINLQNNWVSYLTTNTNRESDQLQQSRIEANHSRPMYLNANNHLQNFNIPPSSSTTMNLLPNPSRKRKLLDFASQTSIIGCSNSNVSPNVVNRLNSQLGFNTVPGNVGNSRNSRSRINPSIQWGPVSNVVQPNTSRPINQPLTASPLIQNLNPFPISVASDSRMSHSFPRYNAARNTIINLRSSNIPEGTGSRLSLNPPSHHQLIPQGVNNDSSTTEQNFGFSPRINNNALVALLRAQRADAARFLQQRLVGNSSLSRAAMDGQSRSLSESMVSFDRAEYHRRVIDMHDRHRDMRLDVDNMSYEELLALEERIGDVNIGLSEEKIIKCLKQWKYASFMMGVLNEVEPCCICREEYQQGENMGRLDCGHDFHGNCIKKWLMIKNSCPICKTTGLAT